MNAGENDDSVETLRWAQLVRPIDRGIFCTPGFSLLLPATSVKYRTRTQGSGPGLVSHLWIRGLTRTVAVRGPHEAAPPVRFHDLRHTYASIALAPGLHPKVVQETLGHSTIAVTLDTCSHVVPAMQREAARAMGAALFG